MLRVAAFLSLDDRDDGVLASLPVLAARAPLAVTLVHARRPPMAASECAEVLATIATELAAFDAKVHVTEGHVDDVAERLAEEDATDLLVMGRSAAAGGSAWGPHGRALLRSAGCPVLVVPAGAPIRLGRALVGMDLSDAALDAVTAARRLCDVVEAVAVVSPDDPGADAALAGDLVRRLDAALDERREERIPLSIARGASPGDALLARADTADLVCVGSRGLGALASFLLGSTAERLAGRSRVPVLVVRHLGASPRLLDALLGRGRG